MISKYMEDYRFSPNEAAEVGMFPEDTGVIIMLILYFLDREGKICRSKLEYYILLLNSLCFEKKGVILFSWDLKGGRIRNFKEFTQFMIDKKLISSNGSAYFVIDNAGKELFDKYCAMLVNIKPLLDNILSKYGNMTTSQVKDEVLSSRHNTQYQEALNNVRNYLNGLDSSACSVREH